MCEGQRDLRLEKNLCVSGRARADADADADQRNERAPGVCGLRRSVAPWTAPSSPSLYRHTERKTRDGATSTRSRWFA
jgi:hypothetical protein